MKRWQQIINLLDPLLFWLRRAAKEEPNKYVSKGNWARAWSHLKRHKLALWGGRILVLLYFLVLFADFFSPYPYDFGRKDSGWQSPSAIRFYDKNGFSLQPFIYKQELYFNEYNQKLFRPVSDKRYYIKLFPKVPERNFWGLFPIDRAFLGVDYEDGVMFFLLGSDGDGRDILSRILYGGRISLSVGILGVIISFSIGLLIGGISGYFGGLADSILMRLAEMIMMTPGFYLMLALRASFPDNVSSSAVYLLIVVIMSFIGWAGLARVIRGMVLSIKGRTYVESARALGASDLYIIIRHILPATFSYAIVAATLSIPSYILGESALSLLTLGIQEPEASWGNMLAVARDTTTLQLYPWILWPGFFIFITVMSYNFLGDGLRDALDPHSNR